jgi:flagellar FliL protein
MAEDKEKGKEEEKGPVAEGEAKPDAAAQDKTKKKRKIVIIVAILLTVKLILGTAIYFLFIKKKANSAKKVEAQAIGGETSAGGDNAQAAAGKEGGGEDAPAEAGKEAGKEGGGEGGGAAAASGGKIQISGDSFIQEMDEVVVNLKTDGKQNSFLKMVIAIEVVGKPPAANIDASMPKLRDSLLVYVRELRPEDLKGSSGLYRLREELLLRFNKIVYPTKIRSILFKEILVQ